MIIDDIDFLYIENKPRVPCFQCKEFINAQQYYQTEWTLTCGSSVRGGVIYCQSCIENDFRKKGKELKYETLHKSSMV